MPYSYALVRFLRGGTGFLTAQLMGFAPLYPRISSSVLAVTIFSTAPAVASFSITKPGNDTISPAGTFYFVTDSHGRTVSSRKYILQRASADLSGITPIGITAAPTPVQRAVLPNEFPGGPSSGRPAPPVYRTFAQSDLAQINAAQNTFLSDPLSGSGISADRKLASGDLPFGTSVVVVDGLQYTTVQAAINALPSIGGAVLIPPGTYAGPTNIPSGTALIGIAASEGVGISTNSVILQYTTSLTLTNISNTRWENLWLDFSTAASAAGLELKAYNASGNAFCVQNQFRHVVINQAGGPSVPALKLSASGSGGTISNSFNKFDHLIIYGNSTTGSNPGPALSGIQLIGAGTPNAGPTVTQNSFNDVWVRGGLLAVWIAN